MVKLVKYLFLILVVMALIVGSFLLYTQHSIPKHGIQETIYSSDTKSVLKKDTLSILTWNVGYCGLGDDMDFFYDGGTRMRTSYERAQKNVSGIVGELQKNSSVDFILLQEVDRDSKRSYHINQEVEIGKALTSFTLFFADNYNVELVPMPLKNPLGKISSGILTLSKYTPTKVTRQSYPDEHPWPTGLFMPKRCFMVTRIPRHGGKELVLINTHNSAYDDGSLRTKELKTLTEFVTKEYKKGNWVIVGGDWNQNPPGYQQQNPDQEALKNFTPQPIPADYLPKGWKLAWDRENDTNRFLNIPYTKGKTMTTTIDLFLLSPNIEMLKVGTICNGFAFSDHQPVKLKVVLK